MAAGLNNDQHTVISVVLDISQRGFFADGRHANYADVNLLSSLFITTYIYDIDLDI